MCFSATASFTAAAVIGATGSLAMGRISAWKHLPLAGIPLIFSAQQTAEGVIWLGLRHAVSARGQQISTDAFLFLALGLWPVLVPVAFGLVEDTGRRRRAQWSLAVLGTAFAAYGMLDTLHHPYRATIAGNSICYINGRMMPLPIIAAYLAAVCLPPLLSSHAGLRLFGAIVTTGLAVSLVAYNENFVSVWCFFAAAASVVIARFFGAPLPRQAAPALQD